MCNMVLICLHLRVKRVQSTSGSGRHGKFLKGVLFGSESSGRMWLWVSRKGPQSRAHQGESRSGPSVDKMGFGPIRGLAGVESFSGLPG